jgi:two-component system, OmpR family, sensor kinase
MTAPMAPPTALGRGTLGRQLVVRVTALVALAALLITAATTVATRQLLLQEVDRQLDDVTGRVRDPDNMNAPGRGPDRGLLRPGQPIGTLAVIFDRDGAPQSSGRLTESHLGVSEPFGVAPLTEAAIDELGDVPTDGSKMSVTLTGLGHYRVAGFRLVVNDALAGTVVVGVPLAGIDRTLLQLLGLAGVLSLLAIVGAFLASRTLVLRTLRPLNRVAATAQQVSQLPLDRGEVALAVRVPPEDADPASEVGRVGQALNHMLNNVEEALAARQASETRVRQFVADASHELRNPLAAIRGYAELTRRGGEPIPKDAAYAMSRVESEADRMSHLVEDLLLLARLDSGPDLDIRTVDLTEMVINAVSDARAAGPDHTWSLALPDEPVSALGDQHRLHQVVANLLANARTHTPPGTRVETGIAMRNGLAVITVIDNGPGIPDAIRNSVFERFTRADTSRVRTPGNGDGGGSTGLGLAIVAAVVEAHQGRVSVTSRPGHTEFVVELPLAPAASHTGPGPNMLPPRSPPA